MNATTRGIFVKQYLHGAAPETIAEIQELAGGLREYYKPAWKSSSSRKSSLRPPVTVALWHSNKSSNLSQGITLLVWFTASIAPRDIRRDRKSTRLNSSHQIISYAVFCLQKQT